MPEKNEANIEKCVRQKLGVLQKRPPQSEALILSRPDRQWHLWEIAFEVNDMSEIAGIERITEYEIGILLEDSEDLVDLRTCPELVDS